jgi:hypothetical protein
MEALQALSPDARSAMRRVLLDVATDARRRSNECWRRNKAPMAAYWRSVSVYARHTARALGRSSG